MRFTVALIAMSCFVLAASASEWKVAPPKHLFHNEFSAEAPAAPAGAKGADVKPFYVDSLAASVEYKGEAHNGAGWSKVYMQAAYNSACWVTGNVFYGLGNSNSQNACQVQYDPSQNAWFLLAFSGTPSSDSWCTARCINWSQK